MRRLAGILYAEPRPLADADRHWLHEGQGEPQPAIPSALWMQAAARSAPGNRCAFFGRLHNRKALNGSDRATSDAALALSVYERRGVEGLRDLLGDWSLAIWDEHEQALLLASDYTGVCPLYYSFLNGRLLWSSNLEHLRALAGDALNDDFSAALIGLGHPHGRTPYANIDLVPCHTAVTVRGGRLSTTSFWKPPEAELVLDSDEAYQERFRQLFQEAVAVRLASPRPVCAELSGGLDSSSIVAMALRLIAAGDVPATSLITFSYDHPNSTDKPFIDIIERTCAVSPQHLDIDSYPPIKADFTSRGLPLWWQPRFDEIRRRMDGAGSEVLLTGQLGDLIAGNWLDDSEQAGDYLARGQMGAAIGEAYQWGVALRKPVWGILAAAVRSSVSRRGGGRSGFGNAPGEDSLTPQFRKRAAAIAAQHSGAGVRNASPSRRKHVQALEYMLLARGFQCPEPLDGVQYTHPYLHRPLTEFMLSIPSAVVCRPGEPRRLMRRALEGIVPAPILRRRSKGTYDIDFLSALRPLARLLLPELENSHLVRRNYVDPVQLRTRLGRLLNGLDCNEPQLRHLMLLEFWLRNRSAVAAR